MALQNAPNDICGRRGEGDQFVGVSFLVIRHGQNASGQIEGTLRRGICQVGPGDHVEMRCIVDSHVVGVAKPDPTIFDYALPYFPNFKRSRIAYIGDSVAMDIRSSMSAGLHPILMDPHDDHAGADFERITSVDIIADELCG